MRKQNQRDELLTENGIVWIDWSKGLKGESTKPKYGGGIAHFKNLTSDTLQLMIDKGFANSEQGFNNSKTIGEFLEFMKQHKECTAIGYVVEEARDDFRLSVTGLVCNNPSNVLREAFKEMFSEADEYTNTETKLRCWYD